MSTERLERRLAGIGRRYRGLFTPDGVCEL
jgi:hypothetical protein